MMHRLDPIRIQMRGNRLHALPLARQQQPGAIAVQPLFLLGMVHRCGERIHVFVELLFFTALTTLCAHALNIETSAAPSARQAMRVSGKLPLSDVCYSRSRCGHGTNSAAWVRGPAALPGAILLARCSEQALSHRAEASSEEMVRLLEELAADPAHPVGAPRVTAASG